MPIIPLSDHRLQTDSDANRTWQYHLKTAIRDIRTLSDRLELELQVADTDFPLLVPEPYLSRIEKGNRDDPLLLQVLPTDLENKKVDGFTADPLGEKQLANQGALQKYQGRILVIATSACAINCRYCFRRQFPYADNRPDWTETLANIRADTSIREVILSGGDPLILDDRTLGQLLQEIDAISHVETIRFHTRLPIVIPDRITDELLYLLQDRGKSIVMVCHINHSREIDAAVIDVMQKLKQVNVTLLNQSVLLRGINDDATTLTELSRQLFRAGILPYYLHLLDPVQGAAHFDVDEASAVALIDQISLNLPGYLVPKLAREIPGAGAKQLIYS